MSKLRQHIEEVKKEILAAKTKLRDLELQDLEEKTGFKRGELVRDRDGHKGILEYGEFTTFWYWRKIKKDGTPSDRITYMSKNPIRVE